MGMLDGSKKGKGKATQVDGKEVDTTSPLPLQICRDKEMLDASRKGKGKATQIDNNLSNRSLPQRVRRERERERLIALSHFEPTNRHLPPLIIREGGIEGTTITVVPETPNQVEKVVSSIEQNNPSKRALGQRLRREREKLEFSSRDAYQGKANNWAPKTDVIFIEELHMNEVQFIVSLSFQVEENETQQQQPRAGQIDLGRWFESP